MLKNIQVYQPTIYSTFKYVVDLIRVPDERSVEPWPDLEHAHDGDEIHHFYFFQEDKVCPLKEGSVLLSPATDTHWYWYHCVYAINLNSFINTKNENGFRCFVGLEERHDLITHLKAKIITTTIALNARSWKKVL